MCSLLSIIVVVCFSFLCRLTLVSFCVFFFFFKQKTAYEMRISDWSSDVCSSDLMPARHGTHRLLSLRQARPHLHRRSRQGVALPLLRLPKTNRIALQRGGLFLPRLRRTARRGQGVQAPVGERPRRVLPFLPRLRIVAVVGPRKARAPDRRSEEQTS